MTNSKNLLSDLIEDVSAAEASVLTQVISAVTTEDSLDTISLRISCLKFDSRSTVLGLLLRMLPDINVSLKVCEATICPGNNFEDYTEQLSKTYGYGDQGKCEEVWTGDHIAYRCRTCGLSDSSCMCVGCFVPEDHEGHDYRIYRCSSGGCCDCGDPLAWKESGFCPRHRGDQSCHSKATMPLTEVEQVKCVIQPVVIFVLDCMRSCKLDCTTNSIRGTPAAGQRHELFSSDVRKFLDKARPCLEWLKKICDVCGWFRQIVGNILMEPAPQMNFVWSNEANVPNFCDISVSQDESILDIMMECGIFLPEEYSDQLGVLYLKLLFDPGFKEDYTNHFINHYPHFVDLYINAPSESSMKAIARFLDRIFCQLFHSSQQVLGLIEEGSVLPYLFSRMLTLFESAAKKVQDAYKCVHSKSRRSVTCSCQSSVWKRLTVIDCNHRVFKDHIYSRLCSDIRTMLVHKEVAYESLKGSIDNNDPVEELEDHSSIHNSLAAYRAMHGGVRKGSIYDYSIRILVLLQQMDPQVRAQGRHVEYESTSWTYAFVLDYEMMLLVNAILEGAKLYICDISKDIEEIPNMHLCRARKLLSSCEAALSSWFTSPGIELHENMDEYSVFKHPISFHLPMHHFYSILLRECMKILYSDSENFRIQDIIGLSELPRQFIRYLIEHPLRIAVFVRQIGCNFWVRNGNVMQQQLGHYQSKYWYDTGVDSDLMLLQVGAVILGGSRLLHIILNKFEVMSMFELDKPVDSLTPLVSHSTDRESGKSSQTQGAVAVPNRESLFRQSTNETTLSSHALQMCSLGEEMLRYVIQIATDRTKIGFTEKQLLRREIVHWLSTGRLTVSQLGAKIVQRLSESPEFDIVVREVGDYHSPSDNDMGNGYYTLKPEFWKEVDPFFVHFSRSDLQKMEQNYRVYASSCQDLPEDNLSGNSNVIPPIKPSIAFPCFNTLSSEILHNQYLHALVYVILHNAVVHGSKYAEGMLNMALYVMSLAVNVTPVCVVSGDENSTPLWLPVSEFPTTIESIALSFQGRNFFSNACCHVNSSYVVSPLSILGRKGLVKKGGNCIISLLMNLKASSEFPDQEVLINFILSKLAQNCQTCKDLCSMNSEETKLTLRDSKDEAHNVSSENTTSNIIPVPTCNTPPSNSPMFDSPVADRKLKLKEAKMRQAAILARMKKQQCAVMEKLESQGETEHDSTNSDFQEHLLKLQGRSRSRRTSSISSAGSDCFDKSGSSWLRGSLDLTETEEEEETRIFRSFSMSDDPDSDEYDSGDIILECALCRDRSFLSKSYNRPFGLVSYFSATSALYYAGCEDKNQILMSKELDDTESKFSSHLQCCGHRMHVDCFNSYFNSLVDRQRHWQSYEGDRIVNLQSDEFLCPICRRLGNCLLPLVPDKQSEIVDESEKTQNEGQLRFEKSNEFSEWIKEGVENMHEHSGDTSINIDTFQQSPIHELVSKFCRKSIEMHMKASNCSKGAVLVGEKMHKLSLLSDEDILAKLAKILTDNICHAELILRSKSENDSNSDDYPNELPTSQQECLQALRSTILLYSSRTLQKATPKDNQNGFILLEKSRKSADILFGRQVLLEVDDGLPLLSQDIFSCIINRLVMGPSRTSKEAFTDTSFAHLHNLTLETQQLYKLLFPAVVMQALIAIASVDTKHKESRASVSWESVASLEDGLNCAENLVSRAGLTDEDYSSILAKKLDSLFADLHESPEIEAPKNELLEKCIAKLCLPYLRKCVIFCRTCIGIELSLHRKPNIDASLDNCIEESNALCDILNLPHIAVMFQKILSSEHRSLMQLWGSQLEASVASRSSAEILAVKSIVLPPMYNPKAFELVKLPNMYAEIFLKYCQYTKCESCNSIPEHPALCLICEKLVCCHSQCCMKDGIGECTSHAQTCGGGFGCFLLLRACTVLLLLGHDRRCVWGSLYLDRNGEEDRYLRRGKTLYLNTSRYEQLRKLVVTQGFVHNTRVLGNTSKREGNRY